MVTFFAGEKEMNRTACICLLNCRPGEHEQRAACYHQREPVPYKIAEKVKVILKMYHRKNNPIVGETNPRGGGQVENSTFSILPESWKRSCCTDCLIVRRAGNSKSLTISSCFMRSLVLSSVLLSRLWFVRIFKDDDCNFAMDISLCLQAKKALCNFYDCFY